VMSLSMKMSVIYWTVYQLLCVICSLGRFVPHIPFDLIQVSLLW